MITEKSAGAIIWRRKQNKIQYLLIQSQPSPHFASAWFFPSGHLEKGETQLQAAQREVYEEVGLKPKFNPNRSKSFSYHQDQQNEKEVTFYLAQHEEPQTLKLQTSEIRQAQWLNYEDAMQLINQQRFAKFSCQELARILFDMNSYLDH